MTKHIFQTEEEIAPVRTSMDTVLVPGARLPDQVFRSHWSHYIVVNGNMFRFSRFVTLMKTFLRSRGEKKFWIASLEPPLDAFWDVNPIFNALEFSVADDEKTYNREVHSEEGAENSLHMDVILDQYFVGSPSCDWAIVAEWDGKGGIAGFRDRAVADGFVDAFCGELWNLAVVSGEARDLYSDDEVDRFLANYGPHAYPLPTSCLMPALRE